MGRKGDERGGKGYRMGMGKEAIRWEGRGKTGMMYCMKRKIEARI